MAKEISKRELKEPDQFETFLARSLQTVMEHKKELYIAAAAVFVVILAIAGIFTYKAQYESKANDLYAQASGRYESLDYPMKDRPALEDAVAGYELLLERYPRSSAGRLAYYNLGNLYHALGSYERSVDAFKKFLAKGSKQGDLKQLAYYGLGYGYEALRDYEKALEAFKTAADKALGEHFRVINYSNIARVYEKMNNAEDASLYYEKVRDAGLDSLLASLAERRIAMLK